MNRIALCFGLVLMFVAGCTTTSSIFTVRLQDIEDRHYYAARDTFKSDETPAVVISGQSGHDVMVRLRKSDLGLVVHQKTLYIKRDELKWVFWKSLPPGKYIAELLVRDETNAVCAFMIEPEAEPDSTNEK
jgi:hypothetical protein